MLKNGEPELMVKMLDHICCDMADVLGTLKGYRQEAQGQCSWCDAVIPSSDGDSLCPACRDAL